MTLKQLLHNINSILILLLVLSTFLVNPAPVSAAPLAPASQGLAVADLVKPDGSLDTSTASGALNLAGWDISLDGSRGPVFSRKPSGPSYSWVPLQDGAVVGTDGTVLAIAVYGSYVYAAGTFYSAGACSVYCTSIARWDGNTWSPLSQGIEGQVNAIAIDSSGHVYAGGSFGRVTGCTGYDGEDYGTDCKNIAKWDGNNWSAVSTGMDNYVKTIAIDDNDNVYVGGGFVKAGGVTVNNIAKWTPGSPGSWSALISMDSDDVPRFVGVNNDVNAIALDSAGNVYMGGGFDIAGYDSDPGDGESEGECTSADGCNQIAKWDGTNWSALKFGTNNTVNAIAIDSSNNVYAGGNFTKVGNSTVDDTTVNNIAKWNGTTWSALGTGTSDNGTFPVTAIDISGNGASTVVYVVGNFTTVGDSSTDVTVNNIAKWTPGSPGSWSALGAGLSAGVWAIRLSGSDVFAGGDFLLTGDATPKTVNYIAAYKSTASTIISSSVPADGAALTSSPTTLKVTFSTDVEHASKTDPFSATNPDNYMLVGAGKNGTFQTLDTGAAICAATHTPSPDDVNISIASISYDAVTFTATLTPASLPLEAGKYRLYVCGAASIHNSNGQPINNGANLTRNFSLTASSNPAGSSSTSGKKTVKLPATGFAPGIVSSVPAQPAALAYTKMSSLWLEIPSQKIKVDIVGVPEVDNNWDVTWLGNQAGWLNGTAYPTWLGNSVITAHVSNANGKPGPFANLKNLAYGNKLVVHQFGSKYTYEVRDTRMVFPDTTGYSFEHLEGKSYLTLITCQGYNFLADNYIFRRVVRAVLLSVTAE